MSTNVKRLKPSSLLPWSPSALEPSARAPTTNINADLLIVARYGGEEFAVILPCTPLTAAVHVLQAIQQGVAVSYNFTTRNIIYWSEQFYYSSLDIFFRTKIFPVNITPN
jgi:GGDEF domain-containing protein